MFWTPRRRAAALTAWLALVATIRGFAGDARPADPLLRLAPADAGVTIVVEDLRGHAREFQSSSLARRLAALPAAREWWDREPGRNFREARSRIATILGAKFSDIRDGLLGEAFLLALRMPPEGRPEDARGLLLLRVADRPLLDRAVEALNEAQSNDGTLVRVSERKDGGSTVFVREFRPDSGRNNEFYAFVDEKTFAWSNSETLIREVVERQQRGTRGLDGRAEFQRVRGRLPARGVVSAFVDPVFLRKVLSAVPRPTKPDEARLSALIGRLAAAWTYVGLSLEWRDGIIIQTEELADLTKLGPSFARWAERADRPDPLRLRVPASTLAFATLSLDAEVVLDVLSGLLPVDEPSKFDNLKTVARGLALGLDPRVEVLSRLGPAVTAYVTQPEPGHERAGLPWVVDVQVARGADGEKAAAALENALRTLLAFQALNAKTDDPLRLETRVTSGVTIHSLSPRTPWAFARAEGRFVLGRSASAVLQALATRDESAASIARLRARFFPGVESFACADLNAIHDFAAPRRAAIAARMAARHHRPEADVARDLDQALALFALFDAAYLTSVVEPGFHGMHREFGLVSVPAPSR